MATLESVSLFSNCGAGDVGFSRAGFQFEVLAEIDERRLSVALRNHANALGVAGDLRQTWPEVVASYRKRCGSTQPALLSACPPCQGMSSAQGSRGHENDPDAGSRDARNLLVEVVAAVANEIEPWIAVVENVAAFLSRLVVDPDSGEPISSAALLIRLLGDHYCVFPFLTDLADYGVPQRRVRAFLTFIRCGESSFELLQREALVPFPCASAFLGSSDQKTLREALADLGARPLDAKTKAGARDELNPMHAVPVWGDNRQYRMVAAIPAGSGGKAWQNSKCERCGKVSVGPEEAVCPVCTGPLLRPVVQEEDSSYRLVKGFRNSSYARMSPDTPAATITTASGHVGSDLTIHPFENRVLSPLECAYLQTFPDDFDWGDSLERWGPTFVRTIIWEAVPPRFTELHGRALVHLLEGEVTGLAVRSDVRVQNAKKRLGRQTPHALELIA
ncbi:MAG: DNA cytosine methyltransferase [Acidimicrobiaceae bacterium]|nr:DNA cytosine methyltransferase [Acidimicrobiaceae bacterium]